MTQWKTVLRRSLAAASVAVTAAMLLVAPAASAQAAPASSPPPVAAGTAPASVDDAGIMAVAPGSHHCIVIATVGSYQAVHCARLDLFTNSAGSPAIRGQSQAYCQRVSNGASVRCDGISTSVRIYDATTGQTSSYGSKSCYLAECPTGRLSALSPGMYLRCNHSYYAIIHSSVKPPTSQFTHHMSDFYSHAFRPTSNCI